MTNDIASELALLHTLKGSAYVNQLKTIAGRKEFHPLEEDPCIFTVGGENGEDYPFLLNAARKAVEHGYQVYILPNPRGIRTADFIFVRKGLYSIYDLKTVSGKNSVDTQKDIKRYFERNTDAVEVLIMKGTRTISVIREDTLGKFYIRNFMMKYRQK